MVEAQEAIKNDEKKEKTAQKRRSHIASLSATSSRVVSDAGRLLLLLCGRRRLLLVSRLFRFVFGLFLRLLFDEASLVERAHLFLLCVLCP